MADYDSFGIKFLRKHGVHTHFEVAKNSITDDNMVDLAKILCLFTVGLFETDSVERKIVYKKDNVYYCDTVDNLCKLFFAKNLCGNKICLKKGCQFFGYNDKKEIVGYEKFSDELKNVKQLLGMRYSSQRCPTVEAQNENLRIDDKGDIVLVNNDDSDEEYYIYTNDSGKRTIIYMNTYGDDGEFHSETLTPDHKYWNHKDTDGSDSESDHENDTTKPAVMKLKIQKDMYTGHGQQSSGDDEFWDFYIDSKVEVDKVYDVSKDIKETAGNWGSCISNSKKVATSLEERYSIFDFDKFDISAKADESTPNQYICSFTPINGVHHAASMWARSCTVDFTTTDVKIELVNSVTVKFVPHDDKYDVITTYYGIDVL